MSIYQGLTITCEHLTVICQDLTVICQDLTIICQGLTVICQGLTVMSTIKSELFWNYSLHEHNERMWMYSTRNTIIALLDEGDTIEFYLIENYTYTIATPTLSKDGL
jgi:hypothetical protein